MKPIIPLFSFVLALLAGVMGPSFYTSAALLETDDSQEVNTELIDVRFDDRLMEGLPAAIYEASLDVQEDPDNPDHWIKIGDIYLLSEKPAQASSAYWRAARLQPDHPKALENLGVCFLRMRDYESAEKIFEALLEKNPANAGALLNAGAAYHGQSKYKQAEQAFQLVIESDPKNYNAVYNLAAIKALTDQPEEAIALYKSAYTINPKSPFSLFAAARVYARLEQPDQMFELLTKGIKQVPLDQAGIILGHPVFKPWSNSQEFRALLTAPSR